MHTRRLALLRKKYVCGALFVVGCLHHAAPDLIHHGGWSLDAPKWQTLAGVVGLVCAMAVVARAPVRSAAANASPRRTLSAPRCRLVVLSC